MKKIDDLIKIHTVFELFSRALIATKDCDPVYPLIPKIIQQYNFDKKWFVFCYVAFYSLESGIIMCDEMRTRGHWDREKFKEMRASNLRKFGHERRGTARNVQVQADMFEDIIKFLDIFEKEALSKDNLHFRKRIEDLQNHGGWAAFKIAEIYEKSLGYNQLAIPDLGLDGRDPNSNDGPVSGLRWLFGRENEYDKDWFEVWNQFGHKLAKGWGVDIGEVETCLCKFHKFKTGKYYIGHDINEFAELEHIMGENYHDVMVELFRTPLWKGINGVQKKWKPLFSDTGKIKNVEFSRELPQLDITQIILEI